MQDRRGPYLSALATSGRPRSHWAGPSPEDPTEWWYFETVEDRGELIAVRQVMVDRSGLLHTYSADHLEDQQGFLTDQKLAPDESDGLEPCSLERFNAAWDGLVVHCPRCGDALVPVGPTLGCPRGGMELSQVMESALIGIAREPAAAPQSPLRVRVGGSWRCPADGLRMVEADAALTCASCGRGLPPDVVHQLVELHVHVR